MRVLFISGSPRADSRSRRLLEIAHAYAVEAHPGHEHRFLDLREAVLPPFRGFDEAYPDEAWAIVEEVTRADALVIASPVFNGAYSSAIKNLFEYVDYKAIEDRVAGFVLVGGGSISFLQVRAALANLMTYFNVLVVPRAVYAKRDDVDEGVGEKLTRRLRGLVDRVIAVRRALVLAENQEARSRASETPR